MDSKRQISTPPHDPNSFAVRESVIDPDEAWDQILPIGMICETAEGKMIWRPQRTPLLEPLTIPVSKYEGRLLRHILFDAKLRKGPAVDPAPWQTIESAATVLLRDSANRQLPLSELREKLKQNIALDPDLIDDSLRMAVSMGSMKVESLTSGFRIKLADYVQQSFDRKDYLAGFSDELIVKSRRIDLLIRHTGTVGSYREELLRNLLRQLVPKRYEVNTGFISGCPRQLDVIIWDSAEFPPLFRDGAVVVVPRAAVRAVIEVKTTLETKTLDDAMNILFHTFRNEPSVVPVFKGIFAYESEYATEKSIADRMQKFYLAKEPDGIIAHEHLYLFDGVSAVCVPNKSFIFEQYPYNEKEPNTFPRPMLFDIRSDWPGDTKMAAFLSLLLNHLELEHRAKISAWEVFRPIVWEMNPLPVMDIYGPDWKPRLASSELKRTLQAEGARLYIARTTKFFSGRLSPSEIATDLGPEN